MVHSIELILPYGCKFNPGSWNLFIVCKENEMTQSLFTYDENFFEAATNWCLVRLDDDRKIGTLKSYHKWLTSGFRQSPAAVRSNECQAVNWFRWRAGMVIGQAIDWIADRRISDIQIGEVRRRFHCGQKMQIVQVDRELIRLCIWRELKDHLHELSAC